MDKYLIIILVLILNIIVLISKMIIKYGKPPKKDMKLLEFNKDERVWVTYEQYLELLKNSKCMKPNFIDVTNLVYSKINFFDEVTERSLEYRMLRAVPKELSQEKIVNQLLTKIDTNRIVNNIKKLAEFKNRYTFSNTGKLAGEYIFKTVKDIASNRSDITVEEFVHKYKDGDNSLSTQKSIIVRITGTKLPEERVIYCAHYDSINVKVDVKQRSNTTAPGADDNASGTSGVIEVFTILANSELKPLRTLEFHLYAGEELGLKGSAEVAESYKLNNRKVIGVLNNDMIGYTEDNKSAYVISGLDEFVDAELTDLCFLLIKKYSKLQPKNAKCGYACSDHASWGRYGFPSACITEGSPALGNINKNIHTVNDTFNNINVNYCLEHIRIALSFVIELGFITS